MSLPFSLSTSTPKRKTFLVSSPTSTTSSKWTTSSKTHALLPPFRITRSLNLTRGGSRSLVVCMAPEEERMTRRSPLDFPIVFISLGFNELKKLPNGFRSGFAFELYDAAETVVVTGDDSTSFLDLAAESGFKSTDFTSDCSTLATFPSDLVAFT
ncbi:unnamed protein product [Fraxinus pennsylvanica]|uniref:Uncharacterized protein n=1 Tax=Fraxinus pennsylvanica TaxID=56036 RepID=A0AAD1ZC27_9LAMI|nr:unnamed protein product [Fraxinus pennsylvanica]